MPSFIQIELDALIDYFVKLAILCILQRHVDSLREHLLQRGDERWQNSGFYVLGLLQVLEDHFCMVLGKDIVRAPGKRSKVVWR